MKYGKLSAERRRVYTLEAAEIVHDLTRETGNGTYTLSEYAARKALLENEVFQWDCAGFGFPDEMNIFESDTPDTFDIEVFWRD
nr:MAG TPA: hypothetical protein [Caudoviricetes sp.]